jgi:cell division protein FtsI (penicillin-binding protein 3)
MKNRLIVLMLFVTVLAGSILARSIAIQVVRDERLEKMARRQFNSRMLLTPRRGMITDRSGDPLAVNLDSQSLAANPSKISNRRTLSRLLSKALEVPYEKISEKLSSKREFTWIKRHLSEGELARLRKWNILSASDELGPGLWMVRESKRSYPHGEMASQILGTVNLDSQGIEGIEMWKEEVLKGKVASVSALRDGLGRPTFIDAEAAKELEDGSSVQLTIDASLQFAVEQELKASVTRHGAVGGSVVVMDSVTGEILALANEPSFNPGQAGASAAKRRNRALTDGYEPGSIMKPIVLAGALSNGWKATDKIHGEGGSFVVQGHRISEAEADEKFEWIPLSKMIQVSSNVVAAKLALKLGTEKLNSIIRSFGFGQKSGMGFPGEISGIIPAKKDWKPINIANIGFGHGVLVTPIQMLRAYAAFANGGHLVQPRIIRKVLSPREEAMQSSDPIESELAPTATRILSEQVVRDTVQAMSLVTLEGGTGIKAHLDGYQVAGKTGTAQVVDPKTGRYSRSKYNASFVGFPVGVEPRIVIFASVQEPKGIYYASETAAPLFRGVLQAAVNRFSIPTDEKYITTRLAANLKEVHSQRGKALEAQPESKPEPKATAKDEPRLSSAGALKLDAGRELRSLVQSGDAPGDVSGSIPDPALESSQWRMPELAGLTSREALRIVGGRKFKLEIRGAGVVIKQTPEAGEWVAQGTKIRVELGEP